MMVWEITLTNQTIKMMNKKGALVKDSNILILGITFKENCPDIRNTKVVDIYSTLSEYTSNITVYDPWANVDRVKKEYGIEAVEVYQKIRNMMQLFSPYLINSLLIQTGERN